MMLLIGVQGDIQDGNGVPLLLFHSDFDVEMQIVEVVQEHLAMLMAM